MLPAGHARAGRRRAPRRAAGLRRHRRRARRRLRHRRGRRHSDRDMAVIAEATDHVAGLAVETGSSGDPSPWTALGVQCAMEVACERAFGTASLAGRSVAVVGPRPRRRQARAAARRGRAPSWWSPTSTRASARSPTSSAPAGPTPTRRCPPRSTCSPRARSAACSTTTPCPSCAAASIAGAANNQLAADAIAVQLADRGIVWAPDFVANAGGIINISVELEPAGYDAARAEERVRGDRRHHRARSSTTPTPRRAPRSPRRSRSPGGGSRRPAPPRPRQRRAGPAERSWIAGADDP